MGRPTSLDEPTKKTIVQAVSVGATFEAAANSGGVSYMTFNNWMTRGANELSRRKSPGVKEGTRQWQNEQIFVEFFEAIKKAKGDRQVRWLAQIEKASTGGNWQAAAWKLERTEPEHFGKQRIEHSGKVEIDLTDWKAKQEAQRKQATEAIEDFSE